jgi:hypothetical protein
MKESDRVLVEILVAAPIDTVWRAFRDPEELRRWFGWEYAGLAEEVGYIFGPETVASDADHTLRFGGMPDRYTLEAHGNHTIVRLISIGPRHRSELDGHLRRRGRGLAHVHRAAPVRAGASPPSGSPHAVSERAREGRGALTRAGARTG